MDTDTYAFFWAVVFILVGLTSFYSPIVDWEVKVKNYFQGIKAKPTKKTYTLYKIYGIFLIIAALFFLLFSSVY